MQYTINNFKNIKFSLVYTYYNNLTMLEKQVEEWNNYSEDIGSILEFILIDDCSKESPISSFKKLKYNNKKLLRVKQDIPWNQDCARNIGAYESIGEWIFMCDMDIVLPKLMANNLFLNTKLEKNKYYIFNRSLAPKFDSFKIPKNIFLVTKENFWKINGYDEDYCGTYGSDRYFLNNLQKICKKHYLSNIILNGYSNHIIKDADSKLDRTGLFRDKCLQIYETKKMMNDFASKNPLRCDYEIIELN